MNDSVIHLQDVKQDIKSLIGQEQSRGYYCGFKWLHNNYSILNGNCTDITGAPTSGKSQFLLELLINLSEFYGLHHVLLVPDMGTPIEVYKDLIEKYTKKSFDKHYYSSGFYREKNNFIKDSEFEKGAEFVGKYFKILDFDKMPTPIEVYDMFKIFREKGYFSLSVDSWKDLKHDYSKRDDLYLDDMLTYRNKIVRDYGGHIFQVIHPLKTEKDKEGLYKAPTSYDYKGGTSWYDNGLSMLTVHRRNHQTNEVEIMINKAKPRSVGGKGIVDYMKYDVETGRYYEQIDNNRKDFAKPEPHRTLIGVDGLKKEIDELPF